MGESVEHLRSSAVSNCSLRPGTACLKASLIGLCSTMFFVWFLVFASCLDIIVFLSLYVSLFLVRLMPKFASSVSFSMASKQNVICAFMPQKWLQISHQLSSRQTLLLDSRLQRLLEHETSQDTPSGCSTCMLPSNAAKTMHHAFFTDAQPPI